MSKPWYEGSSLDELLAEEGVLETFKAAAEKEVIAWQVAEAMKSRNMSKTQLATLMRTSRTQVDKLLNPRDGNVTIATLHKAAQALGHRVEVRLTPA